MTAVEDVLAALEARDPAALLLAEVASLAVEIQPALLRRLRRSLVPEAGPLTEALLWSSDLASTRTPSSLLLRDDVLVALRERLEADQEHLDAARAIVEDAHQGSAEVLRCEEDLVYLGLVDLARKPRAGLDGARLEGLVRERIDQVLRSISGDADRRESLLAWSSRALPTLPSRVVTHEATTTLAAYTAAGGAVTGQALRALFPPGARDVAIGVRWTSEGIVLSTQGGDTKVLRLPPIHPLVVNVEAGAGERWTPLGRTVVPPRGAVTMPVGADVDRLRLSSLRGDGVILSRTEAERQRDRDEARDTSPLEQLAETYEKLRASFPPGATRTAAMNDLVDQARREAVRAVVMTDQIERMYGMGDDGPRVVALACCAGRPDQAPAEIFADALRSPRSRFEQWTALLATGRIARGTTVARAEPFLRATLAALDDPDNLVNDREDSSRRDSALATLSDFCRRIRLPGGAQMNALRLWLSATTPRFGDRAPCVAVLGSSDTKEHASLCEALGERLAAYGWRLSAGAGRNVGKEVVAGFRARAKTSVTVYTTSSTEGDPALTRRFKNQPAMRGEMVASADGVVVIGGDRGTQVEVDLAVSAGLPVLAVTFTGGAAERVTEETRRVLRALKVPNAILGLMDAPGPPEDQAETIVRALNIVMRHATDLRPVAAAPPATKDKSEEK